MTSKAVLLDRYQGAMVGALAGDALLAPYETKKSVHILQELMRFGGKVVPHDYLDPFSKKRVVPKGHPTDDAELTYALALGLAEDGGTMERMYALMRDFIHGNNGKRVSYLTGGEAYGSGGTLRSALREHDFGDSLFAFRLGDVRVLPTNGSLMRNAAVALLHRNQTKIALEAARRQSIVTHVHPACQVACMAHTCLGVNLLQGQSPFEAWRSTQVDMTNLRAIQQKNPDQLLVPEIDEYLALPTTFPTEAKIWPHTGEVFISLRIAIAALLSTSSFEEGINKIAVLGGDTDTYGAIAGSLMGIRYGLSGIPEVWRDALIGREKMEEVAKQLLERHLNKQD